MRKPTKKALDAAKAGVKQSAWDFNPPAKVTTPAAIADRAAATSKVNAEKAQAHRAAGAAVDLAPLPPPEDAEACYRHTEAWIAGAWDVAVARQRFVEEEPMRRRLGVEQKQERMLKAALDGRCNRLTDGGLLAARAVDTSDIPETGEAFFKSAKLKRPERRT